MSTEPFIGEVKLFGFYFAPKYHSACNGQTLAISSNTALFSLLGTTYGGNGQTTFCLPDLQGRMVIGQGNGAGLPSHQMGEKAGVTSVTLSTQNLAPHTHTLNSMQTKIRANSTLSGSNTSVDSYVGNNGTVGAYSENATPNAFMATTAAQVTGATDLSGSSFPVSVVNPYLVMNFCIATAGVFPSRN